MSSRPSGFEDRLKAALLARLPEAVPAPPARSFARRYGVPLAVGVATAAVVAVMTLTGSAGSGSRPAGPPSRPASDAPEVTREPDGSLRFDPPAKAQVPALVDRLKEMGVRAVAVPRLPPSECQRQTGGWGRGAQADPAAGLSLGGDGHTLKVNPKAVPPGHTLVFTWVDYDPLRKTEQGLGFGILQDAHVPSCSVDHREELLKWWSGPPTPPDGRPTPVAPRSAP
ncbi:hypothetical protein [Streptomyces xanthophaeus]|uniref:hypothetical protein n=1 Tax=Streptomyces xanthophaeus TaxID=67385 RepID=UPI00371E7FFB